MTARVLVLAAVAAVLAGCGSSGHSTESIKPPVHHVKPKHKPEHKHKHEHRAKTRPSKLVLTSY